METQPDYSTPETPKSAIVALLQDRPIAYHPLLAKVLGGVKQAVFVSQLLYWTGKGKRADGFIWKTQEEWTEETGLSAGEQRTARKKLVKWGILEEKLKGVPATLHYRLNLERLETCIIATSRCEEPLDLDVENPPIKKCSSSPTIPEITSEITPEREEPPLADSPRFDEQPIPRESGANATIEDEIPELRPMDPPPDALRQQLDALLENDPDALLDALEVLNDNAETTAMFKAPKPAAQEPPEQRMARMRDKFHVAPRENVAVPLEIAVVTEQARATQTLRTDPGEEGDAWEDRPVKEWCAFIRLPYAEQSPGRRRMLAADLRKIATTDGLDKTPQEVGAAIRAMTTSASCEWMRSAGRPTHREFTNVLTNVLCGQTLPEGGNGRHDQRSRGNGRIVSDDMVVM